MIMMRADYVRLEASMQLDRPDGFGVVSCHCGRVSNGREDQGGAL
jgi:hypothetical protein